MIQFLNGHLFVSYRLHKLTHRWTQKNTNFVIYQIPHYQKHVNPSKAVCRIFAQLLKLYPQSHYRMLKNLKKKKKKKKKSAYDLRKKVRYGIHVTFSYLSLKWKKACLLAFYS